MPPRKRQKVEAQLVPQLLPEPVDTTWDDLGALAAASESPEPVNSAAEQSEEEDYAHLLNLEDPTASTMESALFSGDDLSALLAAVPDAGPSGSASQPSQDAIAAQAIENLQAMLADAAAEAEEDDAILSEDEILDEELESDEEPLARLARGSQPTCSTCSRIFLNQEDLSQHIFSHIKSSSFVCEGCGKPFSRLDALKRHTLGAMASEECQKASLEPDAHSTAYTENEHARLLADSLGLPSDPAYTRTEMRPKRITTKDPNSSSALYSKKKKKGAPKKKTAAELKREEEMEVEREKLKPVYTALKAAHIAKALEQCVEAGLDIKAVFRLADVTGEQLALLHFVFSEIVLRQEEFLENYSKGKLKPNKVEAPT